MAVDERSQAKLSHKRMAKCCFARRRCSDDANLDHLIELGVSVAESGAVQCSAVADGWLGDNREEDEGEEQGVQEQS